MKHTVTEVELKNGAKGLLLDIPGASVMSFQFQFRAGNRYVASKDIYETAHLMEHMAFGANERFKNEHDYEMEFTQNGAHHNAYTSDLAMVYEAICADFEWDRIFDLQRLAICHPKFNNKEMEAEKGNVRGELTGFLNNQNRVLWPRLQQSFGEDILTFNQRLKTIANIKLADVKEHHSRTHTLKNMRFVIAGKLHGRKSEIIRQLEAWSLPEGERFVAPKDEMSSSNPVLVRRKEASNLTFGLSLVIPRELQEDELDAMTTLDHILTSTMSSRIYGAARQRGLVYHMFSDTTVNSHFSSWDFGGQVNLDTSDKLFDLMVDQLQKVLNGDLRDDEIEAAKKYALGRYQMGAQTVFEISNFYTGHYFSDDTIKDYHKVPDHINRVSRQKMIDTAQEFIKANTWNFAGVSSGEKEEIVELHDKISKLF